MVSNEDKLRMIAALNKLAKLFNKSLDDETQEIYLEKMLESQVDRVEAALRHIAHNNRYFPKPVEISEAIRVVVVVPAYTEIPEQTTITRREYIENLLRGRFILQQIRAGHRQPTTEEIDGYVAKHIDDPQRGGDPQSISEVLES